MRRLRTTISARSGDKAIYEALMYTNLNTGEIIPWQA